jgi:hypothetical protein
LFNPLLRKDQSQTRSAIKAGYAGVVLVEIMKQTGLLFFTDADAVVCQSMPGFAV